MMTSRQQYQSGGVKGAQGRLSMMLRDMVAGMWPGVLLCTVLAGILKDNVADAAPETFLAAQSITLSGKITAPSCTVKLEKDRMSFTQKKGRKAPEVQILRLNLSQCEANGVGVMFKAERWPDNPVRGSLRGVQSKQRDGNWYYTISPGDENNNYPAWPLRLAEDSPVPEVDKQSGSNIRDAFFSLAEVNYWYDLITPLKESDTLVIPFTVTVHQSLAQSGNTTGAADEGLESNFTLQLSWR